VNGIIIIEIIVWNKMDQYKCIKDFLLLCESKGLYIWLMGGWGLDFLLGKQTRNHVDIDFIVNKIDYSLISEIISGFSDFIALKENEKIKFFKSGIRFDICFFIERENKFYIDITENDPLIYPMPANSFPKALTGKLAGFKARVISMEAQYVLKKGYCHCTECNGKALRKKDKQDLSIIIENLSIPQEELDKLLPGIERSLVYGGNR
jgi:lincosamide nucleotidyltransferase A/C/D/E